MSPITQFATSRQRVLGSTVWHAVCHCRTIVLLAFFTCSQSSRRPRLWCPRKHERWQCDNYWLIAPTRLECGDFSRIIQYTLVRFNKRWALSTWLAQQCCGLLFQRPAHQTLSFNCVDWQEVTSWHICPNSQRRSNQSSPSMLYSYRPGLEWKTIGVCCPIVLLVLLYTSPLTRRFNGRRVTGGMPTVCETNWHTSRSCRLSTGDGFNQVFTTIGFRNDVGNSDRICVEIV